MAIPYPPDQRPPCPLKHEGCLGVIKWPGGKCCGHCRTAEQRLKRGPATCHPEKPHHCRGLCQQCYNRAANKRRQQIPEFREASRRRVAQWRAANLERARRSDYLRHTVRNFGLERHSYEAMLQAQNSLCAICHKPSVTGKRLHVDHDHDTNVVRDLLCHHCNAGMGQFKDSPELLLAAAAYLLHHREKQCKAS